MKIPVIGPADVEGKLSWTAVADAIAEGHRGVRAEIGDTFLHRGPDVLLTRSAWIDGLGIAVKSVTVIPENARHGRPTVQGGVLLFDDATGALTAVIDAGLVTRWKTAGDSVLGARLLARRQPKRLLILGAGAVADALIEAYAEVFPSLERIAVWNRSADRAAALVRARAGRHPVELAGDLPFEVSRADIVATATLSKTPVLRGEWVRDGTHVDLIGAFTADMREADDDLLRKARLFVDARATTLHHIGELKIPLARGVIRESDVLGDLNDLCTGLPGRLTDGDITVFKNGGGAHLDLMTAGVILKAWEAGRG
jgi:ornithine cyclodeaminase